MSYTKFESLKYNKHLPEPRFSAMSEMIADYNLRT